MPTQKWLKEEFRYGYDSGNILSFFPNSVRRKEEKLIGGSYREVFRKALLPFLKPDSKVLEIGPGKGSWTKAILQYIPKGELHVVDFQNVEEWLQPLQYKGRLTCHHLKSNTSYEHLFKDSYFDICWSFGVLCHNNADVIEGILTQTLPKLKEGGFSIHQYGNWDKLEKYGWLKGGIPVDFKTKSDDEIWWPRNNQELMISIAERAGWNIVNPDLGLVLRDSIIILQR